MPTVTAVIFSAMLTTPLVEVGHKGIMETPRVIATQTIQTQVGDTGIDDTALSNFVSQSAKRYEGF